MQKATLIAYKSCAYCIQKLRLSHAKSYAYCIQKAALFVLKYHLVLMNVSIISIL